VKVDSINEDLGVHITVFLLLLFFSFLRNMNVHGRFFYFAVVLVHVTGPVIL
jgi:hypothetical protein